MSRIYLYLFLPVLILFSACRTDESYNPDNSEPPLQPADISLVLTGRVGSAVGDSLVKYIDALNLMLFRENEQGNYLLYRQKILNKQDLQQLANSDQVAEAGYTLFKEVTFDTVPIADYRVVGVGNVLGSGGGAQPSVTLEGAIPGSAIEDILVKVTEGDQAPRIFWGISEVIHAGGQTEVLPVLRLTRKVSMFMITLLKIPGVVDRIDMEFNDTYSSFNMSGDYITDSGIWVHATTPYQQQPNDSIMLNYVMLPTVEGDSTSILATFYLSGGGKQPVTLPKYVFAPNTITKVTATIDTDQPGGGWKVDLTSLITVNVEWNVDQEPPVSI